MTHLRTRTGVKTELGRQVFGVLTQQYLIGGAMRFGNLADAARFAAVSPELFAEYQARLSAPERHLIGMFTDTNMSLAYMVRELRPVLGDECEDVLVDIAGRTYGPVRDGPMHSVDTLLQHIVLELFPIFGTQCITLNMARACREQMSRLYCEPITFDPEFVNADARWRGKFPFPLTYYIDRDETVDAVLRQAVESFRQWAFDIGVPLGTEPGVQPDGRTEYLATYVCARHFVYHGRPMVDEHGIDSMGNLYVEARTGKLHVHKGQLYLNCWTPGTVYRFEDMVHLGQYPDDTCVIAIQTVTSN